MLNGEEWGVAKNLHEIIMCLPDFIESIKQAEDHALEKHEVEEAKDLINDVPSDPILTEVFGKYRLEDTYDLSHF